MHRNYWAMSPSWAAVLLGDHVDLLTGFPFKSIHFSDDPRDIRLVKGANVGQGGLRWNRTDYWPAAELSEYARYELQVGDVILAMDRPWVEAGLKQAAATERDLPALLVQRVARLRGMNGLTTGFLRYVISSQAFSDYIQPIVTGVNVPHISPGQIRGFKFLKPPESVQRRVVAVLAAHDELIENNLRRIEILEEMAQTIYREWFLAFRFPGHEEVRFVDSSLGPIPKGWERAALGSQALLDKGLSYKGAHLEEGGRPMVSLKAIRPGGGFQEEGVKPYTGAFKPRHRVSAGDLLFANTDLTQAGNVIGSPVVVPQAGFGEGGLFSHHLFAVRIRDTSYLRTDWLYQLLASEAFLTFAKGRASGTTVLGFRREDAEAFEFALPPLIEVERFEAAVRPMTKLVETLTMQNTNLRTTRDLLLPRLVSGELDVSDLDIDTEWLAS